ncbi:MAG: 50S ribosomal protein L15 [Candidatus Omnitrophica bacterium]|nr:50S ribosomal protein L15 [Candidatus Omnitrophota bacterium]
MGKTATRGVKGQRSRSGRGGGSRPGFEGGQFPLIRRVPKRGFSNARFAATRAIVKVGDLGRLTQPSVGPAEMVAAGLVRRGTERIKVLAGGELKRSVTVKAHGFSDGARKAIELAGGKAILIARHGCDE